jgi:diguanylate cyclase (GGDEF)-like protein
MGHALVAPLMDDGQTIGVICLTKRGQDAFYSLRRPLLEWAANYLAGTIVRVLSHAVMTRQARQDGLTGLANRRTFDERIEREFDWAIHNGCRCSLVLFDLDHFKSINDTYLHLAGDAVLRQTAEIFRQAVAAHPVAADRAVIARYGGEEIALLLPGMAAAEAIELAETIRAAVDRYRFVIEAGELHVTISAGVAEFPAHATGAQELIAQADAALYAAKQTGRNRVGCATHDDADAQPHALLPQTVGA